MNDRQRQQLVEQYEEAELSLLMYDYAMEEGKRLAKEFDEAQANGLLPEIPEELDHKCRALIDSTFAKMERKTRLQRIVRSAAKAAVILLVVLGVMTTTVMSVDALRIPVLNFIFERSDRFSSVSLNKTPNNEVICASSVETVMESIIPVDYTLSFSELNEDHTGVIIYKNKDNFTISLDVYLFNGAMSIDTENAVQREETLLAYKAWVIIKDGYKVMWNNLDAGLTYILYADGLTYEDFWMIACSLAEHF